jgi:hypothetical protein
METPFETEPMDLLLKTTLDPPGPAGKNSLGPSSALEPYGRPWRADGDIPSHS